MNDNPFKPPATTGVPDQRSTGHAVSRGAIRGAAIGFGLFLMLGVITFVRFGVIQTTVTSMSLPFMGAMIGAVMAAMANQQGKKPEQR